MQVEAERALRMRKLTHVSKIAVSLWGQRVGTIIPTLKQGYYAFQYDKTFVRNGVAIAPLMMPLRNEPYYFSDLPISELKIPNSYLFTHHYIKANASAMCGISD